MSSVFIVYECICLSAQLYGQPTLIKHKEFKLVTKKSTLMICDVLFLFCDDDIINRKQNILNLIGYQESVVIVIVFSNLLVQYRHVFGPK